MLVATQMKSLFSYLIILFSLSSCNGQERSMNLTLSKKASCKLTKAKAYSFENGFCSKSILLNDDSTFTSEAGCEGRSKITLGHWKVIGDSIEVKSLPVKQLNLICNIDSSDRASEDGSTIIYILDKTGIPVRNFIVLPLRKSEKYIFTSNASVVMDSQNKRVATFETGEKGMVRIDFSNYDSLEFPQLKFLTGNNFRWPTKAIPDTIKITMNINVNGLNYNELEYAFWLDPIRYKLTDSRLLNKDMILKRNR